MEQVTDIVLKASAAAFCVCLVIGLVALCLKLFTKWEPGDTKLFNWIVRGLLVSVVGAVGSFAAQQFALDQDEPEKEDPPVIEEQVEMGVALRMAVIETLIATSDRLDQEKSHDQGNKA